VTRQGQRLGLLPLLTGLYVEGPITELALFSFKTYSRNRLSLENVGFFIVVGLATGNGILLPSYVTYNKIQEIREEHRTQQYAL